MELEEIRPASPPCNIFFAVRRGSGADSSEKNMSMLILAIFFFII